MFIVCILILSGIGLYGILKPPTTALYARSLKNDIFPELNMNSAQHPTYLKAQPLRETGTNDFD
ncbi:hypothetical protein HQN88_20020 [Paenibacillus qinlingensis]|nr:hypothetical protein [Paenibacillus qinlingensis]